MTTVPIPTRRRASSAPCFSSRKTSCWADLFKETNAEETNKTPTTVITRPSHPSAVLIAQHYDCNANDRMTTPAATTTDEVTAQPTEQQTEPVNTTTETVTVTEIETETVPKPLAPLPTRLPPSETVQLHMATITQEELRILPTTVPRGRCCVCFSPDTSLVFVCGNEITPAAMASTATTTTTCEGALCLDCAKAYIENIMCDSKYSLPTVRCPGRCFGSIPSASWRGALHYGDDLSSSSAEAEEDVRHKEKEAKLNCTPTVVPCCRSWKDVLLGVNKDEEEKAKEQEARRRMEVESKKQKLKEKVKRRKENIEFESSMVRRYRSYSPALSSLNSRLQTYLLCCCAAACHCCCADLNRTSRRCCQFAAARVTTPATCLSVTWSMTPPVARRWSLKSSPWAADREDRSCRSSCFLSGWASCSTRCLQQNWWRR
mmetsp:Transcript_13706/g.22663  ORF Transcript_13706/g.22663 Transcript_13706/m.22663 type:complete len:432 (-) Transcript_13706:643-1938(-)